MIDPQNKVLACVDRSRFAVHVADYAAWAANRLNAPLEFLHVIDRHPERSTGDDHSGTIGIDAQQHLLTQLSTAAGDPQTETFYLVKVDNAKFSRMVVPGDRLELDVELKRRIRNMAQYVGVARVDGEQVACAEILCAASRD